jgi:hypothetical protein
MIQNIHQKTVKEWLSKQPFEILKWQWQSPYLSPIEHLCVRLKRNLCSQDLLQKSKQIIGKGRQSLETSQC